MQLFAGGGDEATGGEAVLEVGAEGGGVGVVGAVAYKEDSGAVE